MAQSCTPVTSTVLRLTLCGVILSLLGSIASARVDADFEWAIPGPGALQAIADGIEQSRNAGDRRSIEEGVIKYSEALIQGVPDGGFPLSDDRWLGPAEYLSELLQLLDPKTRNQLIEKIDLILNARLAQDDTEERRAALATRVDRDFPLSTLAPELRQRRAARLLERGDIDAFLALDPVITPERRQALIAMARPRNPAVFSLTEGDPLTVARTMSWLQDRDPRPIRGVDATPSSPWGTPRWTRIPAVDRERLFWQGDDDLRRLDSRTGQVIWKVPFFEPRGRALPRSFAAPAALGDLILVTTKTRLLAVDQQDGKVIWEYRLSRLFPPVTVDSDDPEAPPISTPALDRDVVAMSAPITGVHGILIFALLLRSDYVEGRLARFAPDGTLLWSRPVGSASGATYLGLGSAQPLITLHDGDVHVLPHRGLLAAFDLADGALQWASRYPSFGSRGSADALRNRTSRAAPLLASTSAGVIVTPADASSLFLFDSRGELTAELPIGASRWVSVDPTETAFYSLAIAADRDLVFVRPGQGDLELTQWNVPDSAPSITGPPTWGDGAWWIPNKRGFFRLEAPSAATEEPSTVPWHATQHRLDVGFTPHRVQPTPTGVWLDGDDRSTWAVPVSPAEFDGDLLIARLHRARRDVSLGRLELAVKEFEGFTRAIHGQIETDVIQAANRLALDCLDRLQTDSAIAPNLRQEYRVRAIRLFVDPLQAAQVAYREALAAANRSETNHAIELAYEALDASPAAPITVRTDYQATCELSIRRLLRKLLANPDAGVLPAITARDQLAGEQLDSALRSSSISDLRSVIQRNPNTTNGRQASIELGRLYYRRGARIQALWALDRLVELEPATPEGVRARFEVAAIELELGRPNAARRHLELLRDQYGDLEVSSPNRSERVAALATKRLREIPDQIVVDAPTPDLPVEFRPVWRTRTELLHQRKLHVSKVPGRPSLFLTTSQRRLALRDANTGLEQWIHTIDRPPSSYQPDRPRWADELGYFAPPITIEEGVIALTDRERLYGIDLRDGRVLWSETLDPSPDRQGPNDPPTMIERTTGKGGYLVLTGSDGMYYAFRTRDGVRLWKERIPGPLVEDPVIRHDHLLSAYHRPAKLEVRSLVTGEVVRNVLLEDRTTILSDRVGPWFVSDEVAVIPTERGLRATDLRNGDEVWDRELPGVLTEVYQFDELPFFVVEVERLAKGPVLLGIARDTGQLLWRKSLGAAKRTVLGITYSEGHLYILESNALSRRVMCLDVPRAFCQTEGLDLLPTSDLELVWTQGLGPNWDSFGLIPFREWLLVSGEFRCTLGVLDRDLGHVLRNGPFRLADEFLSERARLYHANFYDDTLVLITRLGAVGLQRRNPLEVTRDRWRTLLGLDPLDPDKEATPNVLLAAAATSYREGQVNRACKILERALANPNLTLSARSRLTRYLEGLSQDQGEYSPLRLSVGRIPRSPTIDGVLDEPWNAQTGIVLDTARFFHPMQGPNEDGAAWRGWRDLSVIMFTAWSDEGFHLALDVTDDSVHAFDRESERWLGDCLLMAFDFAGNGGLRPQRDDQLLTLALTVPKPAPAGGGGEEEEEEPDPDEAQENRPTGDFQVNRKADGSGVIYEVTIPWETFREARGEPHFPFPGTHFGLNILLTDDDTGTGASTYLSLSPGQMLQESQRSVWEVFAPEYFPQLMIGF